MKTYLLHSIGERIHSNRNTVEEIFHAEGLLTFDGPYESLYRNRYALLFRRPIIFILEGYVGKDNSFDSGRHALENFCTWEQIFEMHRLGFRLGHHSVTHRDLTTLSDEEVMKEIAPPFPMDYFAYPGGSVNERVAKLVEQAGYKEAWSVTQGDGTQFQRKRSYLNW